MDDSPWSSYASCMSKSVLSSDLLAAQLFLERFEATAARRRHRIVPEAPIAAIQCGAIDHPNHLVRRAAVAYLDHYANERSTTVFAAALSDPVPDVRNMALHSIACERCKSAELCAADVVPAVVQILGHDRDPEVRHKAIAVLLRLSDRDPRAFQAIERAATSDSDDSVRQVATTALRNGFVVGRRNRVVRKVRSQARGANSPGKNA